MSRDRSFGRASWASCALGLLVLLAGCGRAGQKRGDARRRLGSHEVVVKGAGAFSAYSSNYTGRIYAYADGVRVTLLPPRLFINDRCYGPINEGVPVVIDGSAVYVDGALTEGRAITAKEDQELDPWQDHHTTFNGFAFVVRWRKDTIVGQVTPLRGRPYLAVGEERYDVQNDTLMRNGNKVTPLREGDVIHIQGTAVVILRDGKRIMPQVSP